MNRMFGYGLALVVGVAGFGVFAGTAAAFPQTCSTAQATVATAQATVTSTRQQLVTDQATPGVLASVITADQLAVRNADNGLRAAQIDRDRACRIGTFPGPTTTLPAPSTSTTTVNGNCTTVTTDAQNYTAAVNRWNGAVRRYRDLPLLSSVQIADLQSLGLTRDRFRDAYNRDHAALTRDTNTTTTCTAPAPQAVYNITVEAPPRTYTPATTTPSMASPSIGSSSGGSSSSGSSIPSGSVSAGGDDAGFLLMFPWGGE